MAEEPVLNYMRIAIKAKNPVEARRMSTRVQKDVVKSLVEVGFQDFSFGLYDGGGTTISRFVNGQMEMPPDSIKVTE